MAVYRTLSEAPSGDYFLGISLTSTFYFSKQVVSKYYQALQPKARSLLVLVADSMEKYNYIYFKRMNPSDAYRKAIQVGKQYEAGYKKLVAKYTHLQVFLLSDLEHSRRLERYKKTMRQFYSRDSSFRDAVNLQVSENLSGPFRSIQAEKVSPILAEYILDELAVTIGIYSGVLLTKRIQVSPRMDTLLHRVYQDDFPKLSRALSINPSDLQYVIFKP